MNEKTIGIAITLGIVFMVVFGSALALSLRNVPIGYRAVVYKGSSIGTVYDEGWIWKHPLASIKKIQVSQQSIEFTGYDNVTIDKGSIALRTNDSIYTFMDSKISFTIQPDNVGKLIREYPNYEILIDQAIRGCPREIASTYESYQDVLSKKRNEFTERCRIAISENLSKFYINVVYYTVQDMRLKSQELQDSIDSKKASEQAVIRAEYERQTKIIQASAEMNYTVIIAEGQAEAIRIVMEELKKAGDSYLYLKYIDALSDPNTPIQYVIVPTDGGVPILLDLPK